MTDVRVPSEPPPFDQAHREPVTLTLEVWRYGEDADEPATAEDHVFACLPKSHVGGQHVHSVVRSAAAGDVSTAAAMWEFLGAVMEPADYARLDRLLVTRGVWVDRQALMTASAQLFEVYADRPTRPQRRSSTGPTPPRKRGGKRS